MEAKLLTGLLLSQQEDPARTAVAWARAAQKEARDWGAQVRDVSVVEINEASAIGNEAEYVQVRFEGGNDVHYALYDSGA